MWHLDNQGHFLIFSEADQPLDIRGAELRPHFLPFLELSQFYSFQKYSYSVKIPDHTMVLPISSVSKDLSKWTSPWNFFSWVILFNRLGGYNFIVCWSVAGYLCWPPQDPCNALWMRSNLVVVMPSYHCGFGCLTWLWSSHRKRNYHHV